MEKNLLQFKPLTSGLGFQPKQDEITERKETTVSPSIGRALSRATVNNNKNAQSSYLAKETIHTKTVPPMKFKPLSQSAKKSAPLLSNPLLTQSNQAHPKRVEPLFGEDTHSYSFFYLIKRSLAYLFDMFFNATIAASTIAFSIYTTKANWSMQLSNDLIIVSVLLFILLNWTLVTAQEVVFHTTVGKKIFQLTLMGSTSEILIRAICFPISVLLFGLGIIWMVFDSKNRAWHDLVTKIQPIEIAKLH